MRGRALIWGALALVLVFGAVASSRVQPSLGGRIVGHPVPGVVALVAASSPVRTIYNGQFCGGVVVEAGIVLTAAHCVVDRSPSDLDAVVGADNLCRNAAIDGIRLRVSSITVHPKYDRVRGAYDLARLRLDGWTTSGRVRNTSIAARPWGGVFALGWGGTIARGRPSCRLTQKPLRLLATSECEARAGTAERQFDDRTMLCAVPASVPSDDTCSGDSGGPIIAGEDLDEGPVIGIVSWGRDCGTGVPGVYVKPLKGW